MLDLSKTESMNLKYSVIKIILYEINEKLDNKSDITANLRSFGSDFSIKKSVLAIKKNQKKNL